MTAEISLQPGIPITSRSVRDLHAMHEHLAPRVRTRLGVIDRASGKLWRDFFAPLSTNVNNFDKLTKYIYKYVTLTPTSKALDMGSGGGKVMLYLASLGIPIVRGIELNPQEVATSNEIFSELEKNNIMKHESCKSYQGNFFPKDYNPSPVEDPRTRAREFPRILKRYFHSAKWGSLDEEQIEQLDTQNPYQAMGMQLSEFDIIYYYPYDNYDQELINLLGERCKPGTFIINAANWSNVDIPENIEVVKRAIEPSSAGSDFMVNLGTIYRVKERETVEA